MAKYFSCYGFIDIKAVKIFAPVAITLLPNGCRFGEVAKIRKMQEATTVHMPVRQEQSRKGES